MNCRTSAATPVNVELAASRDGQEVTYNAQCAWDAALSEVRLAFVLLAAVMVYVGYQSYVREDKRRAEIFVYSAMFLAMLLLIAAFFDIVEILDSKDDNENLCGEKGQVFVHENMVIRQFQCSFQRYYIAVVLTFLSAVSLVSFWDSKW